MALNTHDAAEMGGNSHVSEQINISDIFVTERRPPLRPQKTLDSAGMESGQRKPPAHPNAKALRKRLTRTDTITFGGPLEMIGPPPTRRFSTDTRAPNPPIRIEKCAEERTAKSSRQESFAGFVKKNFATLKKLAGFKHFHGSSNTAYSSCPNLNESSVPGTPVNARCHLSKSSEAGLYRQLSVDVSDDGEKGVRSPKLLVVPDVFTTSFTYSGDDRGRQGTPARHSSAPATLAYTGPDGARQLRCKQALCKSLSDNPYTRQGAARAPLAAAIPLSEFASEPVAVEVVSCLYLGDVAAAYNERLLCKLNITSIVDLSGLAPEEVPASKKCEVPCVCSSPSRHARARLSVHIAEAYGEDIESDFEQINRFIEGGRGNGKGVLVHCYSGQNASVAAIIQYLMQCQGMQLRKAYNLVMKQRSDLELSPYFQHKLEVLEKKLFPKDPPSMNFRPQLSLQVDSYVPKEAWTEC